MYCANMYCDAVIATLVLAQCQISIKGAGISLSLAFFPLHRTTCLCSCIYSSQIQLLYTAYKLLFLYFPSPSVSCLAAVLVTVLPRSRPWKNQFSVLVLNTYLPKELRSHPNPNRTNRAKHLFQCKPRSDQKGSQTQHNQQPFATSKPPPRSAVYYDPRAMHAY